MAVFYEKLVSDEDDEISVGGLSIDPGIYYPVLDFTQKAWCLHTRCLAFVDHLPLPKLYALLDLVEPTFLPRSNPPHCRYGDFYYTQPVKKRDPLDVTAAESAARPTRKSFWEKLFHCIIKRKKHDEHLDTPSSLLVPSQRSPVSLPPEIWNMVLRHDVGRLLLIANTASQLAGFRIHTNIPSTRFTVDTFDLAPGLMIKIHLISIGGRSYIGNLSSGS